MENFEVIKKIIDLYSDLFAHSGYGEIRIEVRILRRGQKEVILHCGKQYRFVVETTDENNQGLFDPLKLAIAAFEKQIDKSTV